jgi:hypothetical protein
VRALPPHLDPQSMGVLPTLSHYWHRLFSHEDLWKTNLINHFGVKKKVLNQLEKICAEEKIPIDYKQLYISYFRLNEIKKKTHLYININLHTRLAWLLSDESMQLVVLASCANQVKLFTWIPRELWFESLLLSIAAKSLVNEQFWNLALSDDGKIHSLFEFCVAFGNASLTKKLLALTNKNGEPRIILTHEELNVAIKSRNLATAKELLELKDKNGNRIFIPTLETLNLAISFNQLPLIQTLLTRVTPTILSLNFAANAGNQALVQELSTRITPTIDTLNDASRSGTLTLVQKLLTSITPTIDTLNEATKSGNPALVQALLALKDANGNPMLAPTINTLNIAAKTGNIELLHALLALKNKRGNQKLIPTFDTLAAAVFSDNPALVRELLALTDESGNPKIIPTNEIFDNEGALPNNPIILRELLALKDEKGKPRIIPTPIMVQLALGSGNLVIAQELLALKDEEGKPRITPTTWLFQAAVNAGNLATVRILLTKKNEVGEAVIEKKHLTYCLNGFIPATYLRNYLQSYSEILTAYHAMSELNDVVVAAMHLKTAYEQSSLYFFTDLKNMLQNLAQSGCGKNSVSMLRYAVAEIILGELKKSDLPRCEAATLKLMLKEFPPIEDSPAPDKDLLQLPKKNR